MLDPETIATRREAEAFVRAGPELRCRGPRAERAAEAMRTLLALGPALDPPSVASELRAVWEELGGEAAGHDLTTGDLIARLLAQGHERAAYYVDEAARAGCGYDLRELIAEGPLDGAVHAYRCPRCGRQGQYQAPHFPALVEAVS